MQRIALLSVFNKTGIVEFAKELVALQWKIISSGGTAKVLLEAGVSVTDVAEITGMKPILDHRVVTLAPQIHGGLLAREDQREELTALGYPWIDMVCCDLYPLKQEIAREGSDANSIIEKTDIGGPTMLRSGAKGGRIVITDSTDREKVIDWLKQGEPNRDVFITWLMAKAEGIVADYCLASARYHSGAKVEGTLGKLVASCKYGENAYQEPAGLYETSDTIDPLAVSKFKLIEGSDPSYNNLCDLDRLLQTMTHVAAAFDRNFGYVPDIAIGSKHGNPCGAAVGNDGSTPDSILQQMLLGDPIAIHGGLVMTNFPVGVTSAETLRRYGMLGATKRLLDAVIAPSFTDEARAELSRKGGKCRLLVNPALEKLNAKSLDTHQRKRQVRGGFLNQPNYTFVLNLKDPLLEKSGELIPLTLEEEKDMLLAWAIGSTSNSNTITLVKNRKLIGNGVGQQDRLLAAELACKRADRGKHSIKNSIAYSDSFFPFPDGPDYLATAGVRAIFASSGSVNDNLVKTLCDEKGVNLYMLPDSYCRGFFGH